MDSLDVVKEGLFPEFNKLTPTLTLTYKKTAPLHISNPYISKSKKRLLDGNFFRIGIQQIKRVGKGGVQRKIQILI